MPNESEDRPANWLDDELRRWEQADLLSDYLSAEYEHQVSRGHPQRHFVLNIDAPWGYGKTFFLNNWQKDLRDRHHVVLRYDAWANDFTQDPLLSFLSEIGPQLLEQLKETPGGGPSPHPNTLRRAKFINASKQLLKNAGPSVSSRLITAGISTMLVGFPFPVDVTSSDTPDDSGNVSKASDNNFSRSFQNALQSGLDQMVDQSTSKIFEAEHSRSAAVREFKESLEGVIEGIQEEAAGGQENRFKLPIFIMIDELDRCRPDFTIELIECVKHIFSVSDIYFVFASDGIQLQAALEGTYGSKFDAEIYFNRIFTREVNLREPDNRRFAMALIREYDLPDTREDDDLKLVRYSLAGDEQKPRLSEDIRVVADSFALTLRAQHQMVGAFNTILRARHHRGLQTFCIPLLVMIAIWQHNKARFREMSRSVADYKAVSTLENLYSIVFPERLKNYSFHTPNLVPGLDRYHSPQKANVVYCLTSFLSCSLQSPYTEASGNQGGDPSIARAQTQSEPKPEYTLRLKAEMVKMQSEHVERNWLLDYFDQVMMLG